QHRDAVYVAEREAWLVVAVEVADGDRISAARKRGAGRGAEAAASIAEQHRDAVAEGVDGSDVWLVVFVEVADRDPKREVAAGRKRGARTGAPGGGAVAEATPH